ncbi:MAG: hypothetical protein JO121_13465 [Deltaproteobacteria bacterium]|nr:hypothetical protein [Deltaproteobacteria bacterium]
MATKLIEISTILRGYSDLLSWPLVALIAVFVYRKALNRLFSADKIKLAIAGVEVQTTIPVIQASITESLHGRKLDDQQWRWLRKLREEGRTPVTEQDKRILRPLRDAALLRAYPEGYLAAATHVEITSLGRMLVDASERK